MAVNNRDLLNDHDASSKEDSHDEGFVYVYDRRSGDRSEVKVSLGALFDFDLFRGKVKEAFELTDKDTFVIVTTSRQEIHDNRTYEELIESGDTLYVLSDVSQKLSAPVSERVEYLPHYDTIVKSGMYEYYASEGQNPLPFAFAELIDNALSAAAYNEGSRTIEIKLMFDDTSDRHAICVFDNGRGMTSKDLNDWAVYRLSKFNKRLRKGQSPLRRPSREGHVPRSLNSDISYFGVGGKQAIFFIGNATRMITKVKDYCDVHEMYLSKEDFERKEKNKEAIYSGFIRNRMPGDYSHINDDEDNLIKIVKDEVEQKSFTNVFITGLHENHVSYLRNNFERVCRQLAHIYHYYLHGPLGNVDSSRGVRPASPFRNIDIQVVMYDKGKSPVQISLRDTEDDMQTLYIRSAPSVFEFKAGNVEGILRYHPFLYDQESYPALDSELTPAQNDSGQQIAGIGAEILKDSRAPRGNRPVFECYWNGRLIPYTTIDCFDWCSPPKKRTLIPAECYNRFSGVLFTDDSFQVSTNKLTFIDLEVKLRDRSTEFNKVVMGQEQRVQISRAFNEWIKQCHENYDKQIKFFGYKTQIKRPEIAIKKLQSPWCVYQGIEWDGKIFKTGQLVRTIRTVPIITGTIGRFFLYGEHEGDKVFATGGEFEITQEPISIYGEKKVFPLARLDRNATLNILTEFIEEEEKKLPAEISVEWPEGNEVENDSKVQAGSTIGTSTVIEKVKGRFLTIESQLKKMETKLSPSTLVNMEGKVGHIGLGKWEVLSVGRTTHPIPPHSSENTVNLGSHTLQFQVILSDSRETGGLKSLPVRKINFNVTEAGPKKFTVGMLETPLRIGVPFQIPLNLQDEFGNIVKPNRDNLEPKLTASGLEITSNGTGIRGNALIIKDVVALGLVQSTGGKDFQLKVTLLGLEESTQSLKIRLLPGLPAFLEVEPTSEEIAIENVHPVKFNVQILDKAKNVTSQPRLNVVCKFSGVPNLPSYNVDCSSTGRGTLTGSDIDIKNLKSVQRLKARIDLQHHKDVDPVEKTIVVNPSSRASMFEMFYMPLDSDVKKKLLPDQEVSCSAGETISGLAYRLLDEGNRLMNIDAATASKIKVNWAAKINKDTVKQGNLPDIKAPTSSDETKFCQVTLISGGTSLEFSFTIRPVAADASNLKHTCSATTLKPGESLQGDIRLFVTDAYSNPIRVTSSDLTDLSVTAEGLDSSALKKSVNNGGFVIKNIVITEGKPGTKELCMSWRGLKCYQRLELLAGPACDVVLVDFDNTEPITVLNGQEFPSHITVQIVDASGNPAKESNIRCMLARDSGLKLNPPPQQQRTDSKGKATFKSFSVVAARGLYQIVPKVVIGRGTVEGPVILVNVEPDRNKAFKVDLIFEKKNSFMVGETLPVIKACVLAEDMNPIVHAKPKDIVLKLWSVASGQSTDSPPPKALTFSPSKGADGDQAETFYFRDLPGPEQAGPHCLKVNYLQNGQLKLSSESIVFSVDPGDPVKLVPFNVPATPTVSNTNRQNSRVLVKNLKLQLRDIYDNASGLNLNGRITVKIVSDGVSETPCFQSGQSEVQFNLSHGEVTIDSLIIQSQCDGRDGQEYVLRFEASLGRKNLYNIEPYSLPFLFYNDVRKQAEMAHLTKERDHLIDSIRTYRSLFDTTRQLINEMQEAVKDASQQEQKIRQELRANSLNSVASLTTPDKIDAMLNQLHKKKSDLERTPRRKCLLNPGPRGKEILGKVAHLAKTENNDVACVLSWHMASDMDCVITLTTEQAKQVYRESNGRQQVLPLDSIYRKSLPDWNKPLPHVKCRGFKPEGNPVYARDMLIFPNDPDNCKLVFGMLLGDTIIIDNLDAANRYRQEVVKYTHCPTILTRDGDRIRSNGKFGGLQNRAPSLDKMHGAVFAAPLPSAFSETATQIDLLQSLKQAVLKHSQAENELNFQVERGQSEEMKLQYRECLEAERQLRSIEQRLGLTPTSYDLPASPGSLMINGSIHQSSASKRGAKRTPLTAPERPDFSTPSPSKRGRSAGSGGSHSTDDSITARGRRSAVSPEGSRTAKRRK